MFEKRKAPVSVRIPSSQSVAGRGWMVYSELYSLYVAHFSGLNRLYGGLTTLAVTMLWLYVCTEFLFFAGVVNRWLA